MTESTFTSLFINGQNRPASTGEKFAFSNPYTKKVVGYAASASSSDCKDAIEAAGRAFTTWEHTPLGMRAGIFHETARLIASPKYKERIISAIRDETSTIDGMMFFNIEGAAMALHGIAGLIHQLRGETFSSHLTGGRVLAERRAKGVIFAVAPWNAPVFLSIRAVAVPILCGNTVVLKCSEISPKSQAIVAEAFHEAGLPAGVLNFLSMARNDAPELVKEIIAHPLVRAINFTGSDRVGRIIAGEAAKWLKPCVFELGGKTPVVVLEDADITQAARAIVSSSMFQSGQICMSTERVIVQRKVAGPLIEAVKELTRPLKAGEPLIEKGVELSALFTEDAAKNVVSMLKEAQEAGARVLLGDMKNEGAVVQPHILTGVRPGMRLWERESFGPVVAFAEAATVDEAVELANASDYSLTSAVWSKDIQKALDVSSRIRAGTTNINGPTFHFEPMREGGGLGGSSGYGRFDVESYTDVRLVIIHSDSPRALPVVG